jgi:general secretion pathway protein I
MPSRPEKPRRSAGFTLVEVMVALAIVALALPALLLTLDQQIDGTAYLRDRSLAQIVASNRLTEVRLALRSGRQNLPTRLSGSEEMADRDWFWSVQSQATEVPDFSRVEVQVRGSEAADAASLYTLVAFLAVSSGAAAGG